MAEYIENRDIAALYEDHEPRYRTSMARKQAARDLLAGRIKAPLDASILPGEADREALRASTAQKYMLPLKLMNKLYEKKPRITRYPVGIGQRAMSAATKVEQVDNAAGGLLYPHDAVIDLLLNEGDAIVITQPRMSYWGAMPDTMYADKERTRIAKRYAVDAKGRGEDDDYYREPGSRRTFKAHESRSAEYFRSVEMDYRARNVPVEIRAISTIEAVPINPRRKGDRMAVDGIIRKSTWSVSNLLKAGYRWGTDMHMEPTDPEGMLSGSGSTRDATMHEFWGTTPSGHVYTSYCIDGQETIRGGKPAVIDLTEEYGIECLPVAFDYGLSFPGAINPDDRPVPFVNIFGKTWLNLDTAVSSLLVRFFKEANLFRAYKPDAALLQHLGVTDTVPMPEMIPGHIIPVLGDLMDVNSTQGLREFRDLIEVLRVSIDPELPSPEALGGGSNASGYARNVAEADALGAFTQVRRGQLALYEQSMAHFNEQAAAIGKKHRPLTLFVNQEIPVEQRRGSQSSTRAIIEVDPEMFGDVWQVTAEIPVEVGDNIPLAQQLGDFHDRGKIPLEWVLEKGFGDTAPDITMAKTLGEKAMAEPLGLARLNQMAATIAGDDELAAIMQALANQELIKLDLMAPPGPDNVVPSGITAGINPPPRMTGVAQPNVPASQLGGVVAGGSQAGPLVQNGGVGGVPVG